MVSGGAYNVHKGESDPVLNDKNRTRAPGLGCASHVPTCDDAVKTAENNRCNAPARWRRVAQCARELGKSIASLREVEKPEGKLNCLSAPCTPAPQVALFVIGHHDHWQRFRASVCLTVTLKSAQLLLGNTSQNEGKEFTKCRYEGK